MFFDKSQHIAEAFFACAARNGDKAVFSQSIIAANGGGEPRPRDNWSFGLVKRQVLQLAAFLQSKGVTNGSAVAVVSNSRPEWMIADLAVLTAGGVVVSVYQSLTTVDIGYLLYDSNAEYAVVENQEQFDKLLSLMSNEFEVAANEERPALKTKIPLKAIIAFEQVAAHPLVYQFANIVAAEAGEFSPVADITRDSLATIVYTSGTSGPPKGVMQTHGNHLANLRQAYDAGMYHEGSSIVLFLPLAHSFARLMAYIGCLAGPTLHFPAIIDRKTSRLDQNSITRDIAEAGATIIPLVPRILEKMKMAIEAREHGKGLAPFLVSLMLCGVRGETRVLKGLGNHSLKERICSILTSALRKTIRRKLFGINFVNAISGGAKLSEDINLFFEALGIKVLQGYGLTETCVATNVNRLDSNRIGTVGPVLASDIELRLASDGEILFRGPNVARGYLNRNKATAEAWDSEGWFHTGDVGAISQDGYLSITGRKKELIVTAGGKKIAPEAIEAKLKASSIFSQVVLVGEGKPFCCALVTLNASTVADRLVALGHPPVETFSQSSEVFEMVREEVDHANRTLASFETVKRFLILDDDFSIENGFLTPTLKVKRMLVIKRYADEIEALYLSSDG